MQFGLPYELQCSEGAIFDTSGNRNFVIGTHETQVRKCPTEAIAAPARPAACAMAVMGKASAPGRTKTRLVPPLTADDAARLNTAFLQDIVGNLARAGQEADIAPYVAFGPAGSERFFRSCLPAKLPLVECSLPHFGDCLDLAICSLLERGHAAACVLNADSPTLPTRVLVQAARALAAQTEDGIVIGPSNDGGYYLLGVKRAHRRLFDEIDWSTSLVFEQTLQRARELHLCVTMLESWYDVDDAEGLRRLRSDLSADHAGGSAAGLYSAPYTREALTRLSARSEGASTAAAAVHPDS
jgi:rSAM/selenodomain-associated transferase 1